MKFVVVVVIIIIIIDKDDSNNRVLNATKDMPIEQKTPVCSSSPVVVVVDMY